MPTARGSDFGRWREEKLTVERAPRWWVGGRRETTWRASSGGGGAWFVARRAVQSTCSAHGGVGGAVSWSEVPVYVEALLDGNGGAGWLAAGSELWTTVRGGAWRQWEAHRLRGGPGRWLVEAIVDEVTVEEVAGDGGGGLALRADTNRSNTMRERRSKSIWPPQQHLAEDKDSGVARGRWSPTAHGHHPRCHAGARGDRCVRLDGDGD
jgi:hypothetical protein